MPPTRQLTTSTVAARIPYANAAPFYALWADAPFSVRNLVPRELGREATPDLLLIGKNGHRSHEFLSLLAESAELKGKIIVLNRVRDQELAWYYQRALFTVFPSLAEGWGFPVAESLSFGKVCVSSEIDSIREVGGDLVSYVAANDVGSAYKLIKGLIVNPAERARLESLIANRYQPTQWATAANVILGALSNTKTAR